MLTAYAQELLDGFREQVAEAGAPITFSGNATGTFSVLLVFPESGSDTQNAGTQARAQVSVEIERTQFAEAAANQSSKFTVGTGSQVYHVSGIEDDPGCPLIYFSGEEVQ